MTSFFGVPVDAAYHLVSALTRVLNPVLGGLDAAVAIVLLTLAVRLLVLPLTFRALHGQAIQARIAPQLQALRKKYGKQPERFQREMTALYTREGTSPFASLWPILLQWPFLTVMYLLFRSPKVAGQTNTLLTHHLLGVPLGMHWLGGNGVVSLQGVVFAGVFAGLAAACWLAARTARSVLPPAPAPGRLASLLSYVTVVIAVFAPLAAGLYLVTSTGWSVVERRLFLSRVARKSQCFPGGKHQPPGPPGLASPGRKGLSGPSRPRDREAR
jgi:YidC/Oxa1 family membrane protein insertase